MDKVSDLLKDTKIPDYEKSFRDNGYDDLDQIVSMTHEDLQELLEHVQLLDKPGHKKRFLTALDAYKSKVAPSPTESHECQNSENDQSRQREKPPSVLCKYDKTFSFIDRL